MDVSLGVNYPRRPLKEVDLRVLFAGRSVRSALLFLYKRVLAITGALPTPVRSWINTGSSLMLLSIADANTSELETTLENSIDLLLEDENSDALGDYIEFGVCFGRSLACMHRVAQRRGLKQMRLIGFDSFEGLPSEAKTDDAGYWSPRMFEVDVRITKWFLNRAGIDWSRVTLVKGWFSETLNDATVEALQLNKASIIMIDCDMYRSAREALDFCAPLIDEQAIIIFDDWYAGGLNQENLGEKRAFRQFLSSGGAFIAEPIARYGPNACVFKVSRRQNLLGPARAGLGSNS